jgi:hypothetical protein
MSDNGFSKACPSGNHMLDVNYGEEQQPEETKQSAKFAPSP